MQKLLLAVLVLAALLGGSYLLLGTGSEESDGTVGGSTAVLPGPEGESEDEDAAAELADGGGAVAAQQGDVAEAAPLRERTAVEAEPAVERTFGDWDRDAARLVEGRVLLPDGVPADETLQVLALGRSLTASEIYGGDGAITGIAAVLPNPTLHLESDPGADEGRPEHLDAVPALLGVAPVEPDGTFRLRFPDDLACGFVAVDGRYLFSTEATRAAFDGEELVLRPSVGAWVTGRVTVPADVADDPKIVSAIEVELQYDPSRFSFFDLGSESYFSRQVGVRADGWYEFRGVDTTPPYRLSFESDDLANHLASSMDLDPARDQVVDVTLVHGGTVSGTVLDDTGAPVEEARVTASVNTFFGFSVDRSARTETEEDGSFVLLHVPPGEVKLTARKDGFLESAPNTVQLEDRGRRDGVDFELSTGNVVRGRVLFPNGNPVVGAEVEVDFDPAALTSMAAFNAARGAEGDGETGEDGRYRVTGLGKGPFVVAVEAEDPDDESLSWFARKSGVSPAKGGDVDLVVQPMPVVSGYVIDSAGSPVTAFTVQARRDDVGMWMGVQGQQEDFEDPEGAFELQGLYDGAWQIMASGEGYGDSDWISLVTPLSDPSPLEMVLPAAARVVGLVTTPDGTPISGAKIKRELNMQEAIASASGRLQVPETLSDDDGVFDLRNLTPGSIALVASHPDHTASPAFPVTLEEGGTVEDVELRLRVGGTLTGEVYDNEGEPAGDVMIVIQNTANFMPEMTRTEPDGTFLREGVLPGTYNVTAMMGSGGFDDLVTSEGEADMSEFLANMKFTVADVKDGEETHVILGAPPTDPVRLTGKVTHGGEPVTDALVFVFPEGAESFGAMKFLDVNEEGEYEATLDHPGNYMVQVQAGGFSGTQQNNVEFPVTVPEVEEHRLDLELPLGRISGKVVGPDGHPLTSARVTLGTDGGVAFGTFMGGQYVETSTDDEGRYEIEFVRPGTYSVAAGGTLLGGAFGGSSENGRRVKSGVRVAEGQHVEGVDFRLDRAGEIAGQVVDITGTPVAQAAIFVRDESGSLLERFSMITSDTQGRFRCTGIAPGSYVVTARTTDLASISGDPVEVREAQTAEAKVTMDAGTILRIGVIDKTGDPVKARISVVDPKGREVNGMIAYSEIMEAAGNLYDTTEQRAGPLPPGRYEITVYSKDGRTSTKPVTLTGQDERKVKIRLK